MKRGLTGRWLPQTINDRDYEAFCPNKLPPTPSVEWNRNLINDLTTASTHIARLDGAARLLPNLHLFIYSYIRKEAVLSSQIEGTQSSLSDLLLHENEETPGVPLDDVEEVSSYIKALNEGLKLINKGESLTTSLLLDLHRILLSTGRGANKDPGKLRVSQNWIGGKTPDRALFVPPPPEHVPEHLEHLFKYLSSSNDHVLIKSALMHAQFETIHPFRDGNGRLGRLLITLLLCKENLISEPLLYLSLFFKENRNEYYEKLQSVRISGDWESWLSFFFTGITEVCISAFKLIEEIEALFLHDTKLIELKCGRKSRAVFELYRIFQITPMMTLPKATVILMGRVSKPTIYTAAEELVRIGIIKSIQKKDSSTKIYSYQKFIKLIV